MAAESAGGRPAATVFGLFGLFAIIAALPAVVPDNLFLVDYPEHVAAFYTLEHFSSSAELQRYYTIRDGAYPYWGIRLVMALLTPFLSVETAIRSFAVIALLMPALGTAVLHRAICGRFSVVPMLSLLFVYNTVFAWGLLNFMFSAGVAMLVFAGWIGLKLRFNRFHYAYLVLAAGIVIWLHPIAFIVLSLLVGFWGLADWADHVRKPDGSRAFMQLIAIVACFVPAGVSLIMLTDFISGGPQFFIGSLTQHVRILATPLWMEASQTDLVVGLLTLCTILVLLCLGILKVHLQATKVAVSMLAIAFVSPVLLFGVLLANLRIPLFALLVFIAGLTLTERGRKGTQVLHAIFLCVFMAKMALGWSYLRAGSQDIADYRKAIETVPRGAKVLTAFDRASKSYPGLDAEALYRNFSSYLVVDRQAFIPDIFASVEVAHAPEFRDRQASIWMLPPTVDGLVELAEQPSGTQRYLTGWREFYDYLIVHDFGDPSHQVPQTEIVARGAKFRILQIVSPPRQRAD